MVDEKTCLLREQGMLCLAWLIQTTATVAAAANQQNASSHIFSSSRLPRSFSQINFYVTRMMNDVWVNYKK